MEIKQAEISDVPAMAKIGRYFHDISSYGKIQNYDDIRIQNNLIGVINSPVALLLNAWECDKIVGMLAGLVINSFYDPSEFLGQCLFIAVIPEAQQRKVSKGLMQAFEKWAIEQGASILVYSGYSKKFLDSMKRKGYTVVETTVMKKVTTDAVEMREVRGVLSGDEVQVPVNG